VTWSQILVPIATDYLLPMLLPLLGAGAVAVGGWVLSILPGPVRSFLTANVHEKDMNLLLGAMLRGADAAVKAGKLNMTALPLEQIVAYVKNNLPDTVAKLAPSEEALRTMASDAMTAALVRVAKAAEAEVVGK
jgi:hypothetical protein